MFFSPELLSRRDSGFGLLWLAATLGAKSSFKKLPKRSVLTADISQLCDLIAEPAEPLALRLSSNLMIGVARVYKIKQDIFFTDVTTCFNSLKKAVNEMNSFSVTQLQMGQPSMRPDALTLVADPGAAFAIDFEGIFAEWDNPTGEKRIAENEDSDDEFDPVTKKAKQKRRPKDSSISFAEHARADMHTLNENHEHLLSASFDVSFNGNGGAIHSSSQFDAGFDLGDNLFEAGDGDFAEGIGEELARELGEAWGVLPDAVINAPEADANEFELGNGDFGMDIDMGFGDQDMANAAGDQPFMLPASTRQSVAPAGKRAFSELDEGMFQPDGSVIVPLSPFGSLRDSDGNEIPLALDEGKKPTQKKPKRVRLLLDSRTELTDEELQRARAHYMEEQDNMRRSLARKRDEKEGMRIIEEMIWEVPRGVQAPILVDFWLENFRLQVEARTGALHIDSQGEPPKKRRRVGSPTEIEEEENLFKKGAEDAPMDFPASMDIDMGLGMGDNFADFQNMQDNDPYHPESRLRSSEEPGQARRASRPPSVLGANFDFEPRKGANEFVSDSQKSSLFPWDHAGVSSSANGAAFNAGEGSDRVSFGRADVRIRGSSQSSRRESSHLPGGIASSPGGFGQRDAHLDGDNFEFDVPGEHSLESQQSDINLITLERNSSNFLEYAKILINASSTPTAALSFNAVVLKTSSPRVASSAFYHSLVLATKNLIAVHQEESYGELKITVK